MIILYVYNHRRLHERTHASNNIVRDSDLGKKVARTRWSVRYQAPRIAYARQVIGLKCSACLRALRT